jgi:hypothetical protein
MVKSVPLANAAIGRNPVIHSPSRPRLHAATIREYRHPGGSGDRVTRFLRRHSKENRELRFRFSGGSAAWFVEDRDTVILRRSKPAKPVKLKH